ncbi:MAG: hypothetical protein AAFY37_10640 [Pseudomonadota bacterium]
MGRKHRHRRTPRQPRPLTEAALLKAAHRARQDGDSAGLARALTDLSRLKRLSELAPPSPSGPPRVPTAALIAAVLEGMDASAPACLVGRDTLPGDRNR